MAAKFFLGPGGNCATSVTRDTQGSFERLPQLGLNAQELEFVQGVFLKPDSARKLGALAAKLGLRISIHGSYYVNFSSPEKEKREASQKRILDACKIGELLGVKIVLFHPGFRGTLSSKECLELIVESCNEMAKHTKVAIGLETAGKKSGWGTLEEILEACSQAPQCRPVVDWAHVYAVAGGKIDYPPMLDMLVDAKVRDLHCHFEGVEVGATGERRHLPISTQQPPFAPLAKALAERKKDFETVTLISESPLLEQDSLEMKRMLEQEGVKVG